MILEVNVENLHQDIPGMGEFQSAYIVFKYQGIVVGQAWVPVIQDCIPSAELRLRASNLAWPIWRVEISNTSKQKVRLPTICVVVCTRDRTDELARLLPELTRFAEAGNEVLVVDNCPSDDNTAQLVSSHPEIRYILEPRPGLNNARNRGLTETSGEVVAFIDDDALPSDGWLQALGRNFIDPTVAIVTGITMPLEFNTQAQVWFEVTNTFERGFERKIFEAMTMSVLGSGQVGAGVNMAIRRSILQEIGQFDEALDGGTLTLSGGDQEFFYRALAHGYRIVYDPAALVWHKHRREWQALRQTVYGYGVGLFAWWTKALLVDKEYTVLFWAPRWFFSHVIRNLFRSMLNRPGCIPLDLAWAELKGSLVGWFKYLQSQRMVRQNSVSSQISDSSDSQDNFPEISRLAEGVQNNKMMVDRRIEAE